MMGSWWLVWGPYPIIQFSIPPLEGLRPLDPMMGSYQFFSYSVHPWQDLEKIIHPTLPWGQIYPTFFQENKQERK